MTSDGHLAASTHVTRGPQLDELRVFCTAADLGGLGRAAQRLHMSQPAVSKRIKALEELVGVSLLERSARGVTMTPAGEKLYIRARRLVDASDELNAEINTTRDSEKTVRLAISHTAAEFIMPKALVLMHHNTTTPVEIVIANSPVVKRMAAAGEADVGVAACMANEVVAGVTNIPLLEDEIVIVAPMGHPWARQREVTQQELLNSPMVLRDPGAHTRQVVDEQLREHGLGLLRSSSEAGSTQAVKEEIHEQCLPAALSRLALSPADNLEVVTVTGITFPRRFSILHSPGTPAAAATHLINALLECAAALRSAP